MGKPDTPSSPPVENTTPRPGSGDVNQWIMKSLNDLRDDVRELKGSIGGLSTRIDTLERKVMRAVYTFLGVSLTIGFLWAGYQSLTKWFDFSVTIKNPPSQSAQPSTP